MAVTPEELRDGARRAQVDDPELERRVAASRTYYAAYHKCRPIAERQGLFADAGGRHAEVIDALERSGEAKTRSIGYMLRQCRNVRVKADYHISDDFTLRDAETMREQCERIWTNAEAVEQMVRP